MATRYAHHGVARVIATLSMVVVTVVSAQDGQSLVVDKPLTRSPSIPGFLHVEAGGGAVDCDASAIVGVRTGTSPGSDTTVGFDGRMEALGFRTLIVPARVMSASGVLTLVGTLKQPVSSVPTPYGHFTGLVGAVFRSGDIMDALRPIYAQDGVESVGIHRGGGGGDIANELKKPGYAVVGLTVSSGIWNDVRCICAVQFQWGKITGAALDKTAPIVSSETVGSTSAVGNVQIESVKADPGGAVVELKIETVCASNGVVGVGKLVVVTRNEQGVIRETAIGATSGTTPIKSDTNF